MVRLTVKNHSHSEYEGLKTHIFAKNHIQLILFNLFLFKIVRNALFNSIWL
ncbi:hypothetical protein [Citrobacter freundii]|uniref:Uncharacterized protein n=1 Tax=Citrobacter freundii TaxID=546 RepID=A0A7G2IS87_CITFR|nr:hypothetical protein [Citrobacter freundii]